MQEPRIHSRISPMLPDGHWLAGHDWRCDNCGVDVYSAAAGTLASWVETGYVKLEHNPGDPPTKGPGVYEWEPQIHCLHCFATRGRDVFPDMDDKWALTNKGRPQKENRDFTQRFLQRVEENGGVIPDNPWT